MHSSETLPAPPTTGPGLLLQLGRLIIRARSASPAARAPRDRLLHPKLLAAKPSTSQQVHVQPKESVEPKPGVEAQLSNHVHALWNEQIPLCIEVLLAPDCPECYSSLSRVEEEGTFDKQHAHQRALLLERWTMRALVNKSHDSPAFISPQWLLNAVRSQLHFSQLSAWLARLKETKSEDNTTERRRKLSRETCNYKKLEANCDETDLTEDLRKLNVVYSIKIPGESYNMAEFLKKPTDHNFPVSDLGSDVYIKVVLQSLPRIEDIPLVKCTCQPKRRTSKEIPTNTHEELIGKLNDLTIRPKYDGARSNLLDDRMLTPCSENGKHKCNCDDESDSQKSSTNQPKKLDERRLKEIAKYKRRLRKESKMRKLCDSTSSEGDGLHKKEIRTSIPILQAARFDRFRAIGCYRNQTYLTLPASRIETKSPFLEAVSMPDTEFKRTSTVATQTDEVICGCGNPLDTIDGQERKMVRSEATYNLASLDQSEVLLDAINKCQENGARRKLDEDNDDKSLKKHKCDTSIVCDSNKNNISIPLVKDDIIKRPKLRRVFPIVDRINEIVSDRYNAERDIKDLHLKSDDTVFSGPKETKRQKTYSVGDENYVCYENCDYGTYDNCEFESPKEEKDFKYPDGKRTADNQIPSPSEMDRFRWRFDSAASMVFHRKTGLPLTSSPAPLRRGNNCFDFDDSINGISGIKRSPMSSPKQGNSTENQHVFRFCTKHLQEMLDPLSPTRRTSTTDVLPRRLSERNALFHPISTPPSPVPPPASPASPASPARAPRHSPPPPAKEQATPKLRIGPSAGLLGSFEESALKGRLEPVATVHGFTAELGASGAFCPPHKRLPVTVFFYAPGGTNAPYMGHINLGTGGYRVSRSGTVQVSLFNPHGTLVKMFVVLYDLTSMPAAARTFLRQRTLYMPAGAAPPAPPAPSHNKWLRYLIHLRFMTSKSGKLYLHTDIRIIVSRKADLDTATAHSALFRPIPNQSTNSNEDEGSTNHKTAERTPNRVFGGCGDYSGEKSPEICYGNQNGVSYELRSFTYAPENPKYSPR